MAACVASPYCNTVVQWAVADPYSWWRGLSGGALGNAVALDDAFGYKPAAQAVLQALNAGRPQSDVAGNPQRSGGDAERLGGKLYSPGGAG